jgi:hypothetical protein
LRFIFQPWLKAKTIFERQNDLSAKAERQRLSRSKNTRPIRELGEVAGAVDVVFV